MKHLRTFPKRFCFRKVTLCLVVCYLFFSMSPLTMLAGPKGKALGHGKLHGNSYGNLPSNSVLTAINTKVNPAGIIAGSGRIKVNGTMPNISDTSTVTNLSGFVVNEYLAMGSGEEVLFVRLGSNIFVEIDLLVVNMLGAKKIKNNGKIHISDQVLVLAAGDAFSGAIANLDSLNGFAHCIGVDWRQRF